MKQITLTSKTVDHSDEGRFSFSFFCDCCGKEWVSLEKPFSGGVCSMVEHESALKLLWANEHRTAFNEANLDARLWFNFCSLCSKWVCDDCFCHEGENSGICIHCNSK